MKMTVRGVVGAAFLVAAGSSQALLIDDFETGSFTGTAPIAADGSVGASSGGFAREVDASATGNLTVEINDGLSTGVYSHSQDAAVTGMSSVSYDLGGADLAADANALRIELINIDLNGMISIAVDGTSVAKASTDIVFAAGGLPATLDILFSEFGGADFSSVSEVVLTIDGNAQAALDATIDNFETVCTDFQNTGLTVGGGSSGMVDPTICNPPVAVPEPAGIALLGLGIAGFALRRRLK